jgi:serine/threonine protein kinase
VSTQSPVAPVKKGDVLAGKYRVEKVLGAGGMGIVVAARHIELNTLVALKFLLPEMLTDGEAVERFSREARAAVRLKSEHAVRVLDVGKLKSGAPFMVMELLAGQDLGQRLEGGGQLPIAEAVDHILQATQAIAEAHGLGIIHRDLKPRNIFLTRHADGRMLAKVLDFGLAKSVNAMSGGEKALTRTSAIMGSPQYMSPEQMRAARHIDMRTDIWSLGICLYELLTNTLPFDAPTLPEVCALVLTATPQPPEERRRDIPPALSQIILRCIEKDIERRFADVGELAVALEPFASAASSGAGTRTRSVLASSAGQEIYDLGSLPPPATDSTVSDTRTAASFDSKPVHTRMLTKAAVGATTFAIVLGVAGLVALPRLLDRARKSEAPQESIGVARVVDPPLPSATPPVPAPVVPEDPPAPRPSAPGSTARQPLPPPKKVPAPVSPKAQPFDAGAPVAPRPVTTTF